MAFNVIRTKLEWADENKRPPEGDVLVIPANDHLWMGSGPGLELKKSLGNEFELEAVRLGPLEAGAVAVSPGGGSGYRWLYHAVVAGQDLQWVPGAGRRAMEAAVRRANDSKAESMWIWPLYRGLHAPKAEAAREFLAGLLVGLERGGTLTRVQVAALPDERPLFQQLFLNLLSGGDSSAAGSEEPHRKGKRGEAE